MAAFADRSFWAEDEHGEHIDRHSTDLLPSPGTCCETSVSLSFNFRSGRPTVQTESRGELVDHLVDGQHLGEGRAQHGAGRLWSRSRATSFMSPVEVPSLRKKTRKSRTAASRALVSAQTMVVRPEMITLSMPRERKMSSRSVQRKAPKRGFSSTMTIGLAQANSCTFCRVFGSLTK
jgi:hypothetical protein